MTPSIRTALTALFITASPMMLTSVWAQQDGSAPTTGEEAGSGETVRDTAAPSSNGATETSGATATPQNGADETTEDEAMSSARSQETSADVATAEAGEWRHAIGLIGEPKYGPDFEHFDYVNPDAPKMGKVRLDGSETFDSFNPAAQKGTPAEGLEHVYETLTISSDDEPSMQYGLLAEALRFPDDYSSVTFRLNPDARWQDGEPVTAEDVVWSFEKQKEVNPNIDQYYRHVTKAEETGDGEVTFTFDQTGNRELPTIVGQLTVLPKHWWTEEGANRDIANSALEEPMGSGPYQVANYSPGRNITYERADDYWGAELPVNVGRNNFDEIEYVYFRDPTIAFEGFKGDQFDWWLENKATRWSTSYNFPAVNNGWVVQERFENPYRRSGLMVGLMPNLRKEKFQDVRVRQALNLLFDFETMQRTLFSGEYTRPDSFFFNSELAPPDGAPEGRTLEFLDTVREAVPASVFEARYENPVNGARDNVRENQREALRLFREAGYELRNGQMVNSDTGEQFSFEVVLNGPALQGVLGQYQQSLERLGIGMELRTVDRSQYVNRVRSRDFDMIYMSVGNSLSPGNEQYYFWGSDAADTPSSGNYAGVKDPAVDALIGDIVQAESRDDLIEASRALDRVLMANQYIIPSYVPNDQRVARWDRFGRPDELPTYSIGWPDVWWWSEEKAAELPEPK